MGKNKLLRYKEVASFKNVVDLSHYRPNIMYDYKGEWAAFHFGNQHPIVLELACGKGDYALALARKNPHINYIGIDIKGERLWKAAKTAVAEGLTNLMFIRGYIDHIENVFARKEVDSIWITFPDPFLKSRKTKKRLTSHFFLHKYKKILKDKGSIHLKTDSATLYDFSIESVKEFGGDIKADISDVYGMPNPPEELMIQTYYEKKHLAEGKTIKFLSFSLGRG